MSDTTAIELVTGSNEARVDSRLLAANMRNQHQSTMVLIDRYKSELERFGKVRFQIAPLTDSKTGQKERYALLNEDQAFFIVALSRNTARVVDLKCKLVKAFGEARRASQLHSSEYLPTYHALHDAIHTAAAGSSNDRFIHMNVNKLVNKIAGIGAGQRGGLMLPTQSLVVVAQGIAASAMQGAQDHHAGYSRAKKALLSLTTACTALGAVK